MNKKRLIENLTIIAITAILSILGSKFVFTDWNSAHQQKIIFDSGTVKSDMIKKYNDVRAILKSKYYKEVDENNLLEGAIAGMTASVGDRYTTYFTPAQWKKFEQDLNGSYIGIGVSVKVDTDGMVTVVEVFDGSSAKEVGIQPGDKIEKVNHKDVSKETEESIIKMLQSKEGSKISVTMFRPAQSRMIDFDITLKKIKEPNIKSKMLPSGIGYIQIIMFDSEIAKYFKNSLNQLIAQNMKGLIIDVRNNPGGYFSQVTAIADRLLPKGVIVYTEDKNGKKEYTNSNKEELKLPITVLVNGNSASASEILAGAIKDHKKGLLVGTKTFGKGLVQASYPLGDGSGIKVTVQRYFTPAGVCIQGKGIEPDVIVNLEDKYMQMPLSELPEEKDVQLQKAIKLIELQ